jgi:hypothetical protein
MRTNKNGAQELETFLLERGYRKYKQNFRSEDYMYWKGFERDEDGNSSYSIGFAFYDWSKYPQFTEENTMSVSLHFLLGNDQGVDRLDIDITDDDMTVEGLELFGAEFYRFFKTTKIGKNEKKES